MANSNCGPHVELASNDAVRITRCPCGNAYLTLIATGVTVRLSSEALRATSIAMRAAVERMDTSSARPTPTGDPPNPSTIN